jgi:hypothetical protein
MWEMLLLNSNIIVLQKVVTGNTVIYYALISLNDLLMKALALASNYKSLYLYVT